LINDLVGEGTERVRDEPNSFLVQCSAHPKVHLVTERYPQEVVVGATFMYPTKHLSLIARREVRDPRTIALVEATHGYTDLSQWEEIVGEQSKPAVSEGLLASKYDAGITFTQLAEENPDRFRIVEKYGKVSTTWVVYGRRRRDDGEQVGHGTLVGDRIPWFFTGQEQPTD
jgi:hypothetical protein